MITKLLTLDLTWYTDPGHGWLRVPMQTVIDIGVAERISTCSYMSVGKRTAYLEEDCDAPTFLAAAGVSMESAGMFPFKHLDGQCFIRNLPPFSVNGGQDAG